MLNVAVNHLEYFPEALQNGNRPRPPENSEFEPIPEQVVNHMVVCANPLWIYSALLANKLSQNNNNKKYLKNWSFFAN